VSWSTSAGAGRAGAVRKSVKLRELPYEIVTDSPAVDLKRKGAVFTQPLFVAEVEYRACTDCVFQ
jgi:bifunctional non-homologous end joining protein LigD